jgi:hypothetical protein
MEILEAEPIRAFIRRILPIWRLAPSDRGGEEHIDKGLERSNSERAENIALQVRKNGIYRHGPMWAEYTGVLRDGREFFLEASDDALEVDISGTASGDFNEHARWDRKQKIVNTFGQRDPAHDNKAIMYYKSAPQSERIPETLTHLEVSRKFASMLGKLVEAKDSPLFRSVIPSQTPSSVI